MSIAQALKTSRKDRGLKQSELEIPYSDSMVSMIERGDRHIAPDVAPMLAQKLDHPALFAEIARELTGGFGPAWLNGPNVDLHRSSVREKCLEELREAMAAIEKFAASRPPGAETEMDRKARYEHLLQAFDAIVALFHYIGIQCLEYGFSMLKLSRDHYAKLKGKRYVEA